ncbi:MAG: hypothetical protein ACLUT5_12725 [Butyricicoccus sp.]
MNRMESVPDTVDKREGSIIYDACTGSAELAKCYMELDVVMDEHLLIRRRSSTLCCAAKARHVFKAKRLLLSRRVHAVNMNCLPVCGSTATRWDYHHERYRLRLEAETLGMVGNKYTGLLLPIRR